MGAHGAGSHQEYGKLWQKSSRTAYLIILMRALYARKSSVVREAYSKRNVRNEIDDRVRQFDGRTRKQQFIEIRQGNETEVDDELIQVIGTESTYLRLMSTAFASKLTKAAQASIVSQIIRQAVRQFDGRTCMKQFIEITIQQMGHMSATAVERIGIKLSTLSL